MESWMLYALLSIFVSGVYNFILKIVAERGYNNYMFTFLDYLFGTIIFGLYLLYQYISGNLVLDNIWLIALFAGINALFFSLSLFTRVESMRNIDTVIFYPLYKTFGPILVTIFSFTLFQESLTSQEILGIVLGICVPLLLINKTENKIQKNLLLWVMLVGVTAVMTTVSTISVKIVMSQNLNVEVFLFITFFIGACFAALSNKIHNPGKTKIYRNSWMISLALYSSVFHVGWFLFFAFALQGNMAIVFTINSFSILIPIVLSIIFYKEHFNMRKALVIWLSIVSILMFL